MWEHVGIFLSKTEAMAVPTASLHLLDLMEAIRVAHIFHQVDLLWFCQFAENEDDVRTRGYLPLQRRGNGIADLQP